MSVLDKSLELLRPFKNIKEMFKAFGEGDVRGGVKNYLESIPGAIALHQFNTRVVAKAFVPGVRKVIYKTSYGLIDWYLKPFRLVWERGIEIPLRKAAAPIGGVVPALKGAGVLGATAAIDHGVGRLTKSRYISFFDAIGTAISGKPSKEVQKRIDYYNNPNDVAYSDRPKTGLISIGGNPLNMALLKLFRPSLFK